MKIRIKKFREWFRSLIDKELRKPKPSFGTWRLHPEIELAFGAALAPLKREYKSKMGSTSRGHSHLPVTPRGYVVPILKLVPGPLDAKTGKPLMKELGVCIPDKTYTVDKHGSVRKRKRMELAA